MAVTERQRSKARRRAGLRLEREHMYIVRQLRKFYDESKHYRELWGDHFNARRTEAIRSDIISQYRTRYEELLQEEIENEQRASVQPSRDRGTAVEKL